MRVFPAPVADNGLLPLPACCTYLSRPLHSAFGNSAMAEAVKNSHDDVINLLLSYGGT